MPTSYAPTSLPAYRADAKRPGQLETQSSSANDPWNWQLKAIYEMATALPAAEKAGMPKVSPEALVNKMLVEGRADAGTNKYDYNNKTAAALHKTLVSQGIADKAATFAAAILANSQTAKRLGKTEAEIWNGTGTSRATGKSGKDYSQRVAASQFAATAPKNAPLLDYVKRAISGNLTAQEHLTQLLPQMELNRQGSGGDLDRSTLYSDLAFNYDYNNPQEQAVINTLSSLSRLPERSSSFPDDTVVRAALNNTRYLTDMPPLPPKRNASATESTVADILAELPVFQQMMNRLATSKLNRTK